LIAVKSYFDGSKKSDKCLTLACLGADEITWREMEERWEEVRKKRGNPRFLHMTDAMALQGEFEGWNSEDRDHLIDGLLNVFLFFRGHPRINSFTCTVDLIVHERPKKARSLPAPARICARIVFPQMIDWYGQLPGLDLGAVEAYFDRNESFMRHIQPDWTSKKIRKLHPYWELVKTITAVEMEYSPALQMTDFIAWGRNRLESGSHWERDAHYATAVRAANTIRWAKTPIDERALSTVNFREEGYAAINPQRLRQEQNASALSDEFKKFDRMMRELMHVPHSKIRAELGAEKAAKKEEEI
jgi:hypothetical protein